MVKKKIKKSMSLKNHLAKVPGFISDYLLIHPHFSSFNNFISHFCKFYLVTFQICMVMHDAGSLTWNSRLYLVKHPKAMSNNGYVRRRMVLSPQSIK